MHHFSGSYKPSDVNFLIKLIKAKEVSQEEKERAIQSGKAHYSEMISKEYLPTDEYIELFNALTLTNGRKLAEAILSIASHIHETNPDEITLISLLRAGTPVGVLLKRTLEERFGRDVKHYSISIVRDRGIDTNALNYILETENRSGNGIVFVDGWTAKGVITRELKHYISLFNRDRKEPISDKLVVLSDIGGSADVTASFDDYAIPSGILNSTVSGLVSRSIWNDLIGENDFHGAMFYEEFKEQDKTLSFIDSIMEHVREGKINPATTNRSLASKQHEALMGYISNLMKEHKEPDINMIKPGIAEATRVMLRRVPEMLYLKSPHVKDISHLIQLAKDKDIPIVFDPSMPVNATAIISNMRD